MSPPDWDVVGLGDCDVDIFIGVEKLPSWDEKVAGELLSLEGGGVVANFCCCAARLGVKSALLSTVGDDQFGRIALKSLEEFGVDVQGVKVRGGEATYFCVIALDQTGEKALTIVKTSTFFPRWEDVDARIIERGRVLHIAPFDIAIATRAAEHAAGVGALVSVDLEPTMISADIDPARRLLAATDVLFINELTVEKLYGSGAYRKAAVELMRLGPGLVIVTRGASGVHARRGEDVLDVEAFNVDPVDTTGAGDCFNAAFWTARLDDMDLEPALRFASAAAALSIQKVGARAALPTREDVMGFLAERNVL